jgi:hypothetical protein
MTASTMPEVKRIHRDGPATLKIGFAVGASARPGGAL